MSTFTSEILGNYADLPSNKHISVNIYVFIASASVTLISKLAKLSF